MSTQDIAGRTHGRDRDTAAVAPRTDRRVSTETKAAFKTTELMAYIAAVVGVLIAGAVIDESNAGGLGGKQVWLYVTILTVGYMISRGLAKSGSRDPYTDDDH
jgi:F420-0:gamma-glutamyl ligase